MKTYRLLGMLTAVYITMQLVSDATAAKIVLIGHFPVSITVLYFPLTYLFSDVLTEVYGYSVARRVVWTVLGCSILAGLFYQIAAYVPALAQTTSIDPYRQVFGTVPRILAGGWLAVWAGGISNDYVLAKMKIIFQGKHLWLRTIGSTLVGELINTVIFSLIGLFGILPPAVLLTSILSSWLIKVALEAILTPLTYAVIRKRKAYEQEDYYDIGTDFHPVHVLSDHQKTML